MHVSARIEEQVSLGAHDILLCDLKHGVIVEAKLECAGVGGAEG